MNEQTKLDLQKRLDEIQSQSDEAWKAYQAAEEALKMSDLESKVATLKTNWHKLYTAAEGIRAILALEAE